MKTILWWTAPIAMAIAGIFPWLSYLKRPVECSSHVQSAASETLPHVEVAHPQRKTIARKLRLPGEARPNQDIIIYARVPGYVESVLVDRGSWVRKGDLLVKISVPDLEKKLEKEKADLAMCEPSLQKAIAERDWHKAIWARLDAIAKKTPNLVNQEQLDATVGRYRTAEAEIELAKARTKTFQAAVDETQTTLDFAILRAPFDGVISERWVDLGNLVQAAVTKMLHLVEAETIRVRISIPQSDVPSVREDSAAEIAVDELPGQKFAANVSRAFFALNKETKTMAVEIDLKNTEKERTQWIRPGMFARVTLDLDQRPDVLVLPASALVMEKKNRFVFVVKDGVVKKIPIEVGWDNGIEFEVKSGVSEADDVIVVGKNLTSDNDKVRVKRRESR